MDDELAVSHGLGWGEGGNTQGSYSGSNSSGLANEVGGGAVGAGGKYNVAVLGKMNDPK